VVQWYGFTPCYCLSYRSNLDVNLETDITSLIAKCGLEKSVEWNSSGLGFQGG